MTGTWKEENDDNEFAKDIGKWTIRPTWIHKMHTNDLLIYLNKEYQKGKATEEYVIDSEMGVSIDSSDYRCELYNLGISKPYIFGISKR